MFEFILGMDNYEDRVVNRSEFNWGFISTCSVPDGSQPYETAVCSSEYVKVDDPDDADGMIIVEAYSNNNEAQKGHNKWIKIMTENPPDGLSDCYNAGIAKLGSMVGIEFAEVRVK